MHNGVQGLACSVNRRPLPEKERARFHSPFFPPSHSTSPVRPLHILRRGVSFTSTCADALTRSTSDLCTASPLLPHEVSHYVETHPLRSHNRRPPRIRPRRDDLLQPYCPLHLDQAFHVFTASMILGGFVGFRGRSARQRNPSPISKTASSLTLASPALGIAPYVGNISPNGRHPRRFTAVPPPATSSTAGALHSPPVSTGTFKAQFVSANGDVAGDFVASDGISSGSAIYHNGQLVHLPSWRQRILHRRQCTR